MLTALLRCADPAQTAKRRNIIIASTVAAGTALLTAAALLLVWRLRAGKQQQGMNVSQSTIRKLNASSAVDLTFELDKNKSPVLLGKGAFGEVCTHVPRVVCYSSIWLDFRCQDFLAQSARLERPWLPHLQGASSAALRCIHHNMMSLILCHLFQCIQSWRLLTPVQAQALLSAVDQPRSAVLQQRQCACVQVYKARWHGTLVAVKVLKSEDPDEAEAFTRETSILENLHHLHVVAYYDHILTEDGTVGPLSCAPCSRPTFAAC